MTPARSWVEGREMQRGRGEEEIIALGKMLYLNNNQNLAARRLPRDCVYNATQDNRPKILHRPA
jgi:hypothetical protein